MLNTGMQQVRRRLVAQFHHPRGAWGSLAGWVMAHRGSNVARSRWTVALLELEAGDRVLELGCGPGVAVEAASRRVPDGLVVGVDHSETVLRQARRRNAAALREGRVRLVRASYLELPAVPELAGPFDAILAVNALQFADTPEALLRELRTRLRPGGRLAITFQSRRSGAGDDDTRREGAAIAHKLEAAGYAAVRVEELPLEPACAVCVLGVRQERDPTRST